MNAPLYTTEILRLAASLSEPRDLQREDGRAEVRSPTCGSRVEVSVQLDDQRRIEAVSHRVHACAFGQASAALMERHARGRDQAEAAQAVLDLSANGAQLQAHVHGAWSSHPTRLMEGIQRGYVQVHVHEDGTLHLHDVI